MPDPFSAALSNLASVLTSTPGIIALCLFSLVFVVSLMPSSRRYGSGRSMAGRVFTLLAGLAAIGGMVFIFPRFAFSVLGANAPSASASAGPTASPVPTVASSWPGTGTSPAAAAPATHSVPASAAASWPAAGTSAPASTVTTTPAAAPSPAASAPSKPVHLPWAMAGFILACVIAAIIALTALFYTFRALQRAASRRAAARAQAAKDTAVWAGVLAEEQQLSTRWLSYEHDLALLLQFPLMRDMADPDVAAAVTAMTRARQLRTETVPAHSGTVLDLAYPEAVARFRETLDAAEQKARQVRHKQFSSGEQRTLRRAQLLLAKAQDESNYPAERQECYRQVMVLLDGLVDVPASAVRALELATGAVPALAA